LAEKRTVIAKKNPIIPRMGVCDPHMHVFNDRVWLHSSHDAMPGSEDFCTKDWQIWSSQDCIEWQLEGVVHPEDTFMGPSSVCWAVDCAERNGKYYYYFSNGNTQTGVAVSDSPAGPFVDALGRPLLDGTLTTTREYDPAVFIDNDGEYYLVFGGPSWCYGEGCGYFIARLNEDMISLAEEPHRIELDHEADDKASLNRFGDKYYLSYGGFYAISDHVYGPYKFMGHTGASIDHTSYFEWNGQLFNAITIVDHYGEYRSTGICYAHIRENGELVTDPLIVEYGVGQYDSDWNKIEAEWFMCGKNVTKKENGDMPGFWVTCNTQASLIYPKVHNLADKIGFAFRGGCVGKDGRGGVIELRLNGEDGPLLGTMRVNARDRYNWRSVVYGIVNFEQPLPDTADICLVLRPDENCVLGIDFFHFFAAPIENP